MNENLIFEAISQAKAGKDLDSETASGAIDAMLSGQTDDDSIAELLLALKQKGESVSELVGAASAMRRHMTRISHDHEVLLDTCGTGGAGSGTFNISTAIAITASACGVAVAKHGNRKVSSNTGSADVLEVLGVPMQDNADIVSKSLNQIGICFCYARALHPAMRHVGAVRQKLGVKTLFNWLGPLCNPAGATHQLLGVSSEEGAEKVASAVQQLGVKAAWVVHGEDGQDEVSLAGKTLVWKVDASGIEKQSIAPEDFGLAKITDPKSIEASGPEASAEIIRSIFAGQAGAPRDTVVAGTACALALVGQVSDLKEGVAAAESAIDLGAASMKLDKLVETFKG
ncbi:MAG: anthranilate phosphoribosyltransferase [Planctomycetota bacterium]